MELKLLLLKNRMNQLERRDPVVNARIIKKLARRIRNIEKI